MADIGESESLIGRLLTNEGSDRNSYPAEWKRLRWRLLRSGIWNDCFAPFRRTWNVETVQCSEDERSSKFRLDSTSHGDACEMVLLRPTPMRASVCISTQIGCGVGCVFCATGRMGLLRNLNVDEILEQVLLARCRLHELTLASGKELGWSRMKRPHLRNVVFMGMGEPLHNEEAVREAISRLIADSGFGFSPRRITVSTAGVPTKMIALAKAFPEICVALSLHAGEPQKRRKLMPRATHSLDALRETIREMNQIQQINPVWLEWVLLRGVNDSEEDAKQLLDFCEGLRVEINVIPYNPTESEIQSNQSTGYDVSSLSASDRESQRRFVKTLRDAGIFTTLRHSLGQSIQAACGQLASQPTVARITHSP